MSCASQRIPKRSRTRHNWRAIWGTDCANETGRRLRRGLFHFQVGAEPRGEDAGVNRLAVLLHVHPQHAVLDLALREELLGRVLALAEDDVVLARVRARRLRPQLLV